MTLQQWDYHSTINNKLVPDHGDFFYNFDGTKFAASTFNLPVNVPFPDNCPAPLVIKPSNTKVTFGVYGTLDEPTRCTLPCPIPLYTQHEQDYIKVASFVMVWLALVFSGVLSLTFTIFHSQRHNILTFWYNDLFRGHFDVINCVIIP